MSGIPIAVEILAVNPQSSCVEFKVYNLDKTHQTLYAEASRLFDYINRIQSVRGLGYQLADLMAQYQDIEAELKTCDSDLEKKKEEAPKTEEKLKKDLEDTKANNLMPEYDKRLSETMTSQGKIGGSIAS